MSAFSLRCKYLPLSCTHMYARTCTRGTRLSYLGSSPGTYFIDSFGYGQTIYRLSTLPVNSINNGVCASPTCNFSNSGVGNLRMARSQSRNFNSGSEDIDDMPEGMFHEIADSLLEGLEPLLEGLEKHVQEGDFDVVYSQGVLTIELGEHGSWVLNKQTPNRQIWWSSPISGPKRYKYDMDTERWVNTRDGKDMIQLLKEEIKTITGEDLDI